MPTLVRLRDELWTVESTQESAERTLYLLRSAESGEKLRVLSPPDLPEFVASDSVSLDQRALSPFGVWQLRHELLQLTGASDAPVALHAGRIQLEPYQFVPLTRLLRASHRHLLIADDVGLGKTVEAGLCITEQLARGFAKRVLLVVPPGLVDQWFDEMLKRFGLSFAPLEDSPALDAAQTALADGVSPWGFHDLVITSIEFLKRPDVQAAALRRSWDMIVGDEAHYLALSGSPANPHETQRSRLGEALRAQTPSLILLTATPHNGYQHSFRSLLELVEPTDAALVGDGEHVRQRVARSMVRRLKQQITRTGADGQRVPAFQQRAPVQRIDVHASSEQEREIFRLVSEYCSRTMQQAEATDQRDVVSFAMQIVKKRMLSSRLALLRTVEKRLDFLRGDGADELPSRRDLRELQGDLPLPETQAERLTERLLRASVPREERRRRSEQRQLRQILKAIRDVESRPDPKVARLVSELRDILLSQPDEKAIVFTEYRDTLEAIRLGLQSDTDLAGTIVDLTGGLTSAQRRRRIEEFATPQKRILLATDAASEGLNLQHFARRLYHVELPWNPNRLEQRNGRIDRHGQRRQPMIAYLFYADSPEDRILDRLVSRIEQMQGDRVATPDIVGVIETTRLPDRLLRITEVGEVDAAVTDLVRVFEEEQARFTTELAPLLAVATVDFDADTSTSADPILDDDLAFESAMLRHLGTAARATPVPHVYRIDVPIELQGPRVATSYPRATFRRSIAIADGMHEVEFIHRFHALARGASASIRLRLTAAPSHHTRAPSLAVRRLDAIAAPLAVFTFLDLSFHKDGRVVAVGVSNDGESIDTAVVTRCIAHDTQPGNVPWSEVTAAFEATFESLRERAADHARDTAGRAVQRERERRAELGAHLRRDVEVYRRDRLVEIDREESAELAGTRDQVELFRESRIDWNARRAAIATHAERRLGDISRWESEPTAAEPEPLGVLLVLPGVAE